MTYSLGVPTGLSHEHLPQFHAMAEQERIAEARMAYRAIQRPEDLGSPTLIGRLFGVPSHRPVPTSQREDVFDAIERERRFRL